ncbi:MAG: hypothetical protein JXR81_04435 [Candidatus Goldbacteria bacterium]|nr:hypothetical protein [Candidatus Goldiibacteriota bacterium]
MTKIKLRLEFWKLLEKQVGVGTDIVMKNNSLKPDAGISEEAVNEKGHVRPDTSSEIPN